MNGYSASGSSLAVPYSSAPELAPPARELVREEIGRAGVVERRAGPVDAALALQPLVGDAVEVGRDRAHLLPDSARARRMRSDDAASALYLTYCRSAVTVFASRPRAQIGRRSPSRPRLAGRLDGLAHALHAAVGVGEGAVLFGEAGRGQDHVRVDVGLVEEDVLGRPRTPAARSRGGRGPGSARSSADSRPSRTMP